MAFDDLIISRQDWRAKVVTGIADLVVPVKKLYLHHEGGGVVPATLSIEQECAKMRSLQAGMMSRGYADIAYGPCVFMSGRCYEGRDLDFVNGGTMDMQGATMGQNAQSIALLFVGNFLLQPITDAAIDKAVQVIKLAIAVNRLTADCLIDPHSAAPTVTTGTTCPTDAVRARIPEIRLRVKTPGPAPTPTPSPSANKEDEMIIPKRLTSKIGGRVPLLTFDPGSKVLALRNGPRFDTAVDTNVWDVKHYPQPYPFGVSSTAQLKLATAGALEYSENLEGTAAVIGATGDSGTFGIAYLPADVQPAPAPPAAPQVDVPAIVAAVLARIPAQTPPTVDVPALTKTIADSLKATTTITPK